MRLPSPMGPGARFATIPKISVPRSQFDLSHGHTTTFDVGDLIPITWIDILPGDTMNIKATIFMRLSTPVFPIMDNIYVDLHYFFTPYRLLWPNFTKMLGEQEDPGDSIAYTVPQLTVSAAGFVAGRLPDYLGVPTAIASTTTSWTHGTLPVRNYYKVWNDWYRDENLQDTVNHVGTSGSSWAPGDGPDGPASGGPSILKRGKRHDYFTTCLPWLQKGTAVTAAISGESGSNPLFEGQTSGEYGWLRPQGSTGLEEVEISSNAGGGGSGGTFSAGEELEWYDPALEVNINTLRESLAVQKLLERSARGGTRYPEILANVFGVTDPQHLVLQRPEFLGSGSAPMIINPVAQTSETNTTELGTLGGVGTSVLRGSCYKSFTEHGILMAFLSARTDLRYQDGLERYWSKETRYDFYVPDLAHLGEQSVLNKEIYIQDTSDDESVFGYQERWAEYRYKQSRISGEFRSNHANTLEAWHLGLDFGSLPTLNSTFIEESPDMTRVLASVTNHNILCDSWFEVKAARPLPMYSIPGLGARL